MKKRPMNVSAPLLAFALVMAMCQVASAWPGYTGNSCMGCHNKPGDDVAITPGTIDIKFDGDGVVTFDIAPLTSDKAAIILSGLDDANLDASVGVVGDSWHWDGTGALRSGADGNDLIDSTGSYQLDLAIGAGGVEALYGIDVLLIGQGQHGLATDFNVKVVPEPSTLALLSMAGLGICVRRRRRQSKQAVGWVEQRRPTLRS